MIRGLFFSLVLFGLFVPPSAWAGEPQAKSSQRQKQSALTDVEYKFDLVKLRAAADAFHFLRSFVDYFYLLLNANGSAFQSLAVLPNQTGGCVGDAHPENFGVLLNPKGEPIFTANDMDDAGPCPIAMDLLRLLVSTRLYDSKTDLDVLVENYHRGLKGAVADTPQPIREMEKKSVKNGFLPSPKVFSGEAFVRDARSRELTLSELKTLWSAVQGRLKDSFSDKVEILDSLATSTVGGGSGGLTRFELLLRDGGLLLHLEIKEEVRPAIASVASAEIPAKSVLIWSHGQKLLSGSRVKSGNMMYPFSQINSKLSFNRSSERVSLEGAIANTRSSGKVHFANYELHCFLFVS